MNPWRTVLRAERATRCYSTANLEHACLSGLWIGFWVGLGLGVLVGAWIL